MSDVVIRSVEARDVPGVVALVKVVLAEFGIAFGEGSATDQALFELPGVYTDAGGAFWVADKDGAIIGSCGVYPLGDGSFELRKMYLGGASRGLGLGARLLSAAIAFVKDAGASALVLDTTKEMTTAIGFYERHGFVRDDAQIRGSRCDRGYRLELNAKAPEA